MKKFLSIILFLAIACGMMYFVGDDLRLIVENAIPSLSASGTTAGGQGNSTTATTAGGGVTDGKPDGDGTTAGTGEPNKPTDPTPPTPIITDGGYYFQQLSEAAKTVYSAIYSDPLNTEGIAIQFATPISVTVGASESEEEAKERLQNLLLSEIQPALDALVYDHPDIDWIRAGDGEGSTFHFATKQDGDRFYIDSLHFILVTEEREGGVEAHRDALKAAIEEIEISGANRYELLLAIQREICARTVYTLDGVYAHDAAGVFLKGEAVCDGYAKALKLLCDRYGIPCVIVAGTAVQTSSSEAHAWNYVQMEDGKWYAVDVTWNDKDTDEPSTDYFLVGRNSKKSAFSTPFCESHLPSGHFSGGNYEEFEFPPLENEHYEQPTEEDGEELAA